MTMVMGQEGKSLFSMDHVASIFCNNGKVGVRFSGGVSGGSLGVYRIGPEEEAAIGFLARGIAEGRPLIRMPSAEEALRMAETARRRESPARGFAGRKAGDHGGS